jgi:branched-chain amino acid transport system substrate-binding protein
VKASDKQNEQPAVSPAGNEPLPDTAPGAATAGPEAAPMAPTGPSGSTATAPGSKNGTPAKAPDIPTGTASPLRGGPSPTGPAATASAAGSPSAPNASAAAGLTPNRKANYASDVGVTADTIKVGLINMASATRSLGPAISVPSEQVADSAVKSINAAGGVAGRKLQLVTCDDGGDVSRARACYEKLKKDVFAFVPSETWLTDTIHDRLLIDKVPWLSWGWFKSEYEDPWMFPCHANGLREAHALSKWAATQLKPKTIGILYLNVREDIAAKEEVERTMASYGVKVVAQVAQEWDSPDESQHVLAMRAANPDLVMSFTWPGSAAKFFHDAGAQNWAPPLGYAANHMVADPGGYGPIFSTYVKDKVIGVTSWLSPSEDTPGLRDYRETGFKYHGTESNGLKWKYGIGHHISQSAYACTRVFAKAAQTLGPDLTRDALKRVLETQEFDSGMGQVLHWAEGDHGKDPYAFNREFLYKWVSAPDGGWDLKRIMPDPVYKD